MSTEDQPAGAPRGISPEGVSPGGAVTGLWHVGLTVRSLQASLGFYRDGLGFQVVSQGRTSSVASQVWGLPGAQALVMFLSLPDTDVTMELFEFIGDVEQYSAAARPWDFAHSHFAMWVENLDALYGHLAGLGFRSRSGDVATIVEGPNAGAKVVYMIDPDGYHVELFQRAA